MHRGCNCRQLLVPPGARAPEPFVDFREILRDMPADQQTKAVGRANYTLIEKGVIPWDEVVTKGRVRTLREVVSRRKLSVDDLTKAGVDPRVAARAHAAVNTPEHQILYEQRRGLIKNLKQAGLTDDQIKQGVGGKMVERVGIQNPLDQTITKIAPHWTDAESLAKFLKLDVAKVARALTTMRAVEAIRANPAVPAEADARVIADAILKGKDEGVDIELITTERMIREFGIKRSEADRTSLFYRWQDHTIYLNPSSDVWREQAKIKALSDKGYWVARNVAEMTDHEIGHREHNRRVGERRYNKLKGEAIPVKLRGRVISEVSQYAADNPREFVAEVWTAIRAGKSFSPEIMSLYGTYGGPNPREKP